VNAGTGVAVALPAVVALAAPVVVAPEPAVLVVVAVGILGLLPMPSRLRRLTGSLAPACAVTALGVAGVVDDRVGLVPVIVVAAAVAGHLLVLDAAEQGGVAALRTSARAVVAGSGAAATVLAASTLRPLPWLWTGIVGLVIAATAYLLVTTSLARPDRS
jgi:hypothetical protein